MTGDKKGFFNVESRMIGVSSKASVGLFKRQLITCQRKRLFPYEGSFKVRKKVVYCDRKEGEKKNPFFVTIRIENSDERNRKVLSGLMRRVRSNTSCNCDSAAVSRSLSSLTKGS